MTKNKNISLKKDGQWPDPAAKSLLALGGKAVLLGKTRQTETLDVMGYDLGSRELPAEEVNTYGTQCRHS